MPANDAAGSNSKKNPHEFVGELNRSLQTFSNDYLQQFHLKIPSGAIHKVNEYRDAYFDYLKDSVYKSNICYLLQLIDYQLWLYRLFRPSLSIENSYFYQLLVTMGIVAEAIANALLLNPLIEENAKDRSEGSIAQAEQPIAELISRQNFQRNIELLVEVSCLDKELADQLQEIRTNIRNIVHIQSWDGRLYQTLTNEDFAKRMATFREFLARLKAQAKLNFTAQQLRGILGFSVEGEVLEGELLSFNRKGGFGFLRSTSSKADVYFHISNFAGDESKIAAGLKVTFVTAPGKRGVEGKKVTPK